MGYDVTKIKGNSSARKLASLLYRLSSVFCLFFTLVLLVTVVTANPASIIFFACLVGVLFLLIGCWLAPRIDKLEEKTFRLLFIFLLLLYFMFLFIIANSMKYALPVDTQVVYDSTAEILEYGTLGQPNPYLDIWFPNLGLHTNADYFCRFPTNIPLLLTLVVLYKIGGLFGVQAGTIEGQSLGILFNSFAIVVAVLFACLLIRRIFRHNSSMLYTLCLFSILTPLYYSAPNFYNDVLVLAPELCGAWLFVSFLQNRKWPYIITAAIILSYATILKLTAGVAVIALLLYALITQKEWANTNLFRQLIVFFVTFFATIGLFVVWYRNSVWFDFSRSDELSVSVSLLFCFGSHGDGSYSHEDALYSLRYLSSSERSRAMWLRAKDNYAEYSLQELLNFFHSKILATWNEGNFEGSVYAQWPLTESWTYRFVLSNQRGFRLTAWWAQVYMVMLYFCGFLDSLIVFFRKKYGIGLFYILTITGTMAYLLFFETAPRRALIAIPFFLLSCVDVLENLQNYIHVKKRTAS